jgi:hypothetical protein
MDGQLTAGVSHRPARRALRRLFGTALAVTAAAAALAIPAPAGANVAQGAVAGTGIASDDWNDEGVVDRNSHAVSGATGLWQLVLYADGAIEQNGSVYDLDDVDCDFGPNTQAATRSWQGTHSVGVDGSAGPQTFTRAGRQLHGIDDVTVDYVGRLHTIRFFRAIGGGAAINGGYIVTQFDFDFAYYDRKPPDCF